MSLEACLPAHLRGPDVRVVRIAAGLSGAGVYRVESAVSAYVLKTGDQTEPIATWQCRVRIQELAAKAGLAPPLVHVDVEHRAVLSAFVVDRSFPALYFTDRERALARLGRMLRRVHALPLLPDAPQRDAQGHLSAIQAELSGAGFRVPEFAADAIERALTDEAPTPGRAAVLSHNDVNPTNLLHDGENLLLLDWDAAGANEPFYDLATASVFFRMEEDVCLRLLTAYEGEPVSQLPVRFAYDRRLMAAQCGANFLNLARRSGHSGARETDTRDATPTLGEFYGRIRAGELDIATAEGQWAFGLALLKTSRETGDV